ncbi:MAG TPA: hypothetical protein VIL29_09195 [Pseudothermotoga sp.]|uniref:hypothetical protein n=1 Tax=Thermotoga profunda TaxID=1508420 RepID=UPI000596F9C6|nr:hypothetical protein [Thermotoga profunda]
MTSVGMAVVVFLVCFVVFTIIYFPVNKQGESFTINPFPRVVMSSPFISLFSRLKTVAEQIFFYKKALSMGQKITLNLSFRNSVVRARSFSAYQEMINEVEKKAGMKPVEKKIILKIQNYEYLIYSSFVFKDVQFIYKPRVTLTNDGYVLSDHIDVAKVILMALNGEGPDVDLQKSQDQLIGSLVSMSYKYGIEVVKAQ